MGAGGSSRLRESRARLADSWASCAGFVREVVWERTQVCYRKRPRILLTDTQSWLVCSINQKQEPSGVSKVPGGEGESEGCQRSFLYEVLFPRAYRSCVRSCLHSPTCSTAKGDFTSSAFTSESSLAPLLHVTVRDPACGVSPPQCARYDLPVIAGSTPAPWFQHTSDFGRQTSQHPPCVVVSRSLVVMGWANQESAGFAKRDPATVDWLRRLATRS
jgi:hypothetical protein